MLGILLRSKAEVRVLGVVLFRDGLHLREIARSASVSPYEAKRELDALAAAGILGMEKKGNMSIYSANPSCPFLDELRRLYMKTEGIGKHLSSALLKVPGILYAFIYGSFARGDFGGKSDIDVFIAGSADEEAVSSALLGAQAELGREINFVLWTESDLRRKMREGGSFVKCLVEGKKVWLAGDADGFAGNAQKKAGGESRARRQKRTGAP